MTKVDRKLEYRGDFPDLVFDNLSSSRPVVIINGNIEDQIQVCDKLYYLVDLLIQKAVEKKEYDFVILYNAADKNMQFGDEYLRLPKKELGMKEDFSELRISLSSDNVAGSSDQIAKLLDPNVVKSHAGASADSDFFTILKKLATEYTEKTFLVIIDHGDDIFPDEANTPTGASHATFPSRLTDIVRNLKGSKCRNVVVLDNKGRISGSLTRELPQLSVPHSTEAEVKNILSKVIQDQEKLIQATRFAVTLEISVLMEMVNKPGTDVDELLSRLIKLRTDKIEQISSGLLKATMGWKNDEVALSPGAKAYCDGIANNFFKKPGLVGRGVLLVGPPGTGKSIFPQYIASQIGVPFLRMESLNTEGLSGKNTQKLEAVFNAIEANKPCIVLIDEIDMFLPSGEGAFRSDNDDQFRALFQAKIADDNAMRGVLFFGASNHPENIATPLTRSGRFGEIIAVLPPKTVEERIQVFKAVWNQLKNGGDLPQDDPMKFSMASDDVLTLLLQDLPEFITGGDLKRMIVDAIKKVDCINSKYTNIWEALFYFKKILISGKYIKKGDGFDEMVDMSLKKQTIEFEEQTDEPVEFDPEEAKALALVRMVGDITESMRQNAVVQSGLEARQAELQTEKQRMTQLLDVGMQALGDEGEKIKGQFADLKRREKEMEAQLKRLSEERVKFDAHIDGQRTVFANIIESFRGDLIDNDKKALEEIEKSFTEISGYNVGETKNPETVIAKIDDLLFSIAKLKVTPFGIFIGKDRIDQLDANLRKERGRFKSIVKVNNTGRGINLPPRNLGTARLYNLPDTQRGESIGRVIRGIWATTTGKVATVVLSATLAFEAIYYVTSEESTKSIERIQQSPIITFNSKKEAIEKGYIVIKDGIEYPKEGYEWAYSEKENAKFPKGDKRRYAVRKK